MKKVIAILILFGSLLAQTKDITIHVMWDAPTHDIKTLGGEIDSATTKSRYKKGDIVGIYLTSACTEDPNPSSRLVFANVTDVPVTTLKKAQKMMEKDTATANSCRRLWCVDPAALPQAVQDNLDTNRVINKPWSNVKPFILNKHTGVAITNRELE